MRTSHRRIIARNVERNEETITPRRFAKAVFSPIDSNAIPVFDLKNQEMNMDWLELQDKVGRLWKRYFDGREIPLSRIESAKNRDIGEQAKSIDAVIRIVSRSARKDDLEELQLTEDEKDVLAVRLD